MLIRARLPHREVRRFARVSRRRVAIRPPRRRDDRAPDHAAARRCRSAAPGLRRRRGLRPLGLRAGRRSSPVSAHSSAPGWPSRSPRGMPGSSSRGRGSPPGTASRSSTPGPCRLGLPRRAPRRPPQHRCTRAVHRGAGDEDRPARVLPVPAVSLLEVDELAESERGVRGFGSSAHCDEARASHPRLSCPALARPDPALSPREARARALVAAGRGRAMRARR